MQVRKAVRCMFVGFVIFGLLFSLICHCIRSSIKRKERMKKYDFVIHYEEDWGAFFWAIFKIAAVIFGIPILIFILLLAM